MAVRGSRVECRTPDSGPTAKIDPLRTSLRRGIINDEDSFSHTAKTPLANLVACCGRGCRSAGHSFHIFSCPSSNGVPSFRWRFDQHSNIRNHFAFFAHVAPCRRAYVYLLAQICGRYTLDGMGTRPIYCQIDHFGFLPATRYPRCTSSDCYDCFVADTAD
jgi:hypothetical protein